MAVMAEGLGHSDRGAALIGSSNVRNLQWRYGLCLSPLQCRGRGHFYDCGVSLWAGEPEQIAAEMAAIKKARGERYGNHGRFDFKIRRA
jgi:hypothetical protein